jgi:uncharacterized membrane protein
MVEVEHDAATGGWRFILSANGSMTPRQMVAFLTAAGIVMVSIGIGFSVLGLWLVLPFSGAEWLLLAYAFNVSQNDARVREVLTIDAATVQLERGRQGPEQSYRQSYRFQRAWLALDWKKSEFNGHPSRLTLRSHGKEVDIGRFLAEPEREKLVRELRQILN